MAMRIVSKVFADLEIGYRNDVDGGYAKLGKIFPYQMTIVINFPYLINKIKKYLRYFVANKYP
jgi:hypothetical protein